MIETDKWQSENKLNTINVVPIAIIDKIKRDVVQVKSIENGLEEIGSPKAVWQFGDDTLNIYQEYSPSELGMKSTLPKKPTHQTQSNLNQIHRDSNLNNSMRKFYLSASNGNLSVNTSFVSTDFSGDEFVDDEVYR